MTLRILALVLAFLLSIASAQAYGEWTQGYQPEFHQSDPNAPYILLPPYTGITGDGALTNYRTLVAQSPLTLSDMGATMQLSLDLTKVPINLGGTDGTTQQEAVNNILGFSGVTLGDLAKYDGTNWVRVPVGTANQVLKTNAGGTDFDWTDQGGIINAGAEFYINASDGTMPNAGVVTVTSGLTKSFIAGGNATFGIDTAVVATTSNTLTMSNKTLTAPSLSYVGVTLKGTTNNASLDWADWAGTRSFVLPDPGTASSTEIVLGRGTQTLNGTYTFAIAPKFATNTVTSSTGNTITFPNAVDTVVYLNATQELANKTLNAPIISSASTITLLQTGGNYTLTWSNPSSARHYTIEDVNGDADFAMKTGTATDGGIAFGNGNLIAFTGVGTAGQTLVSAATSDPAWGSIDLRGGGLGITSLANQSLIVGSGGNTVSALAKGSANQYLQMDGTGTNVAWRTSSFGTVTNVSVGDLSPLFTSSVANSSTAPSVSYSLTAAAAGTLFGNFGNTSGTPSYNLPGSSNQLLGVKSGGGLEYKTLTAGRNINIVHSAGDITIKATGATGAPSQGNRLSIDRFAPVPLDGASTLIWLIPNTNGRISIYTSSNEWVEDLVDVAAPPSLTVPATTSTNYDVYASDTTGGGTVTIGTVAWNTAGTVTEYSTVGTSPWSICLGPDGNLWFTEQGSSKIGKITTSGTLVEYSTTTGAAAPLGICLGPDGNLWFCEGNASKIGKITTAGTVTEYATTTGAAGPSYICVGPDGNLWFTEQAVSKIGKITTSGTVTEYATTTGSADPRGICAGPDGNLWFCELGVSKVGKITTAGTVTEYTTTTGSSGPFSICAGPDGNLWFTENSVSKIGKITTSGAITEYATTTGSAGPSGICVGPDGNLWYGEPTVDKVAKSTISGVMTEYNVTVARQPKGVCTGPDGNLWFCQYNANKIAKVTADMPASRGQQDGVWWTGNAQQRLVGCIRTGTISGSVPDNTAERFVYNWDNQEPAQMRGQQTASTWTYNSTTTRNANANTTNGQGRCSFLLGRRTVLQAAYDCTYVATSNNASVGISFDGVQNTAQRTSIVQTGVGTWNNARATQQAMGYPGLHFFQAIEACIAGATTTFYGTNNLPATDATPYGASSVLTVESKR